MTTYRGLGIVYQDGLYLGIVRYDLTRERLPEQMINGALGKKCQVRGSVVLMQGELPLNREITLHMENGRDVLFHASPSANFGTHATRFLAILNDDPEDA